MPKITSLDNHCKKLRRFGEPFYGLLCTRDAINQQPLDLDPDFQRGHVWSDLQQSLFVGHMLDGGDISPVIVNFGPTGEDEYGQVIDGKQRITACLRWEEGEIGAELSDGQMVWAADLDARWRMKCGLSIGMAYARVNLTRAEVLDLYIRLNRGGTVHTEAEIAKVRALLAKETSKETV